MSPYAAAFDGQRILVTNYDGVSLSLFQATTLVPIGHFSAAGMLHPAGACSDGSNFWVSDDNINGTIGRF